MDHRLPLAPDDRELLGRPRGPAPVWLLVALIGVVLGAASVAAALTVDNRDFAARHASVLASRAP